MADVTSSATIKGINQRIVRPLEWHAWDISILQTVPQAADVILLPDRWDYVPLIADLKVQIIVASDAATTLNFDLQQVKVLKTTNAVTNLASTMTNIDMRTVATNYPGTGVGSLAAFSTDFISNPTHIGGTHWASLRLSVAARTGAGTGITMRFIVMALMGRSDY